MRIIIFQIFINLFFSPIVRFIWIKKIKGLENLPNNKNFIIAANHQSYIDFISLISIFDKHLTFLAAEKFYTSFFWRPIMKISKQIKVDRKAKDKSEVIKRAIDVLNRNKILAIFPQGTRSRNGKIEKYYPGAAKIAIKTNKEIIPIGIKKTFDVLPPHKKFPKIKKIVEINIGKPISTKNYKNKDFSCLINKLMNEISRLSK